MRAVRFAVPRLWLASLALAVGVGCGAPAMCVDTDLDGYGPGCTAGPDCDPNDAARNVDCDGIPAPDCNANPTATGCPCLSGGVTSCLDTLAGVGPCRSGRTQCTNGYWGACEGGVGPSQEYCDGTDQDCDGVVDEGVVSPCGGCNQSCVGDVWGEGPAAFEAGDGLALTRLGALTLATTEQTFPRVWVPNRADGTLSRIDATTAMETARYDLGGTEPTRVAVDWAGDAWSVSIGPDEIPLVTKVAGERDRCVDANGDGSIESSSGPSDVPDASEDECVLMRAPAGHAGGIEEPALAIDGDRGLDDISGGNPWVGLDNEQAVVQLDGLTGAERQRIETPGFSPYAASFDRWGTLWMAERDGVLARIDPVQGTVELIEVPLPCYLLYGLAIDTEGRILLTGFSCDRIFSYDPEQDHWATQIAPTSPRAAAYDPAGDRFWMAHTPGNVSEVAIDPLRIRNTYSVAGEGVTPFETIGVAVDALDQIWTVSSQGASGGRGVATRLDPDSGDVTAQVVVGGRPHVQGDLTGARVRTGLVPSASATHVFHGCAGGAATTWLRAHVDADPGTNGSVMLEARHAASESELTGQSFVALGTLPDQPPPYELSFPDGGVVEVRVTLTVSGAIGAPRVRRIGLQWMCPGPI